MAAVIGLGTIPQNDGGFRRGGTHRAYAPALPLALADVIMVLVPILRYHVVRGSGRQLLIPPAFLSLKPIPAAEAYHSAVYRADGRPLCVVPHPAALFVANKTGGGAIIGSVIVHFLSTGRADPHWSAARWLFLKFLGNRLPFKPSKITAMSFQDLEVRAEKTPCRR